MAKKLMETKFISIVILTLLLAPTVRAAREYHVSTKGNDSNEGTKEAPLRTIQHAADLAQAGDVITVHEGIYRERVNPPRGGTSDQQRITYQAAPGEKVVITGSEIIKGWEKVGNDTWKVTIPNKFFGEFNPYTDLIHGDWFLPQGRLHHTGAVYLNGVWLGESATLDPVLAPAGATPLWYLKPNGVGKAAQSNYLVNIAWLKAGAATNVPAPQFAAKRGEAHAAPCTEGGQCVGYIRAGDWLRYDGVDFGAGTESVELHLASKDEAYGLELRLDGADGELLGTAKVAPTGDWRKWASVTAKIKPLSGKHNLCIVIKQPGAAADKDMDSNTTTIWAQFKDVNPNDGGVEINVRKTIFTPDKTGINYITVRGFTMRNAATNWAPPTAGQIGIVTAYWCKGWIIEDNDISYSRCCGIALGKYGDEFDNTSGYTESVRRALKNGWNKETIGSHIVRNNRVSFCGQTGIVGSMGCAYSTITGNDIHDIHTGQNFAGWEMAGIKFHGAIDVTIDHNHIYRCGDVSGIWLDWMAQGTHVTGNLMHDNTGMFGDLLCEMQHGPILVANNLFLSLHMSFYLNSQGIAFVHNLIMGPIHNIGGDSRSTPVQVVHSTEIASMYNSAKEGSGDHRFYNNLFVASCNLNAMDNSVLPCFTGGNVFTKGTQPSKFDANALLKPEFDSGVKLTEKPDGWYLTINEDKAWRDEAKCKLVTTELLGSAKVPNVPFENVDGSAIRIDTDYFGNKRDANNPFPGPIEVATGGSQTFKVWPKN